MLFVASTTRDAARWRSALSISFRGPGARSDRWLGAADRINPVVVEAMAEVGVDLSRSSEAPDGRGRAGRGRGDHDRLRRRLPIYPGKRYEDWELEDPVGKELATVRQIRDQISERVRALLAEVAPDQSDSAAS